MLTYFGSNRLKLFAETSRGSLSLSSEISDKFISKQKIKLNE